MSPNVKLHATLLPLVAASAGSLAGAVWDRGLRWEMRVLLGELAVLFILFPAAFYGTIYALRFRWWLRTLRGVCGACGRNPTVVETHAVPSEALVFETTDRMTALAQRLGGKYSGWDAKVER